MTRPQADPITGKVELVLDNRELLINRGRADGVEIGMRFVVPGYKKVALDSGTEIELEYPKTIVKIVRLQEPNMSIGRTFRTIKGSPGITVNLGPALAALAGSPDRIETIKTNENSKLQSQIGEEDRAVIIGDPVRQTRADEFYDDRQED